MSSQDEPIGGNPPTYGDLFRGKTRDGPLGHLGRPPEPKLSGVTTPQVSSVVQVPGKAKADSDEGPKIQALRARLKQKYGETFFSGKPVSPPQARPSAPPGPGGRPPPQEERRRGKGSGGWSCSREPTPACRSNAHNGTGRRPRPT